MENKTIRVFDTNIDGSWDCPMRDGEDNTCNYLYAKKCIKDITKCIFSKPLSKEDIESCGFNSYDGNPSLFDNDKVSIIMHSNFVIINEVGFLASTLFKGYINNLPEFKLVLKMLNIE